MQKHVNVTTKTRCIKSGFINACMRLLHVVGVSGIEDKTGGGKSGFILVKVPCRVSLKRVQKRVQKVSIKLKTGTNTSGFSQVIRKSRILPTCRVEVA